MGCGAKKVENQCVREVVCVEVVQNNLNWPSADFAYFICFLSWFFKTSPTVSMF